MLRERALAWAERVMASRQPDFEIGPTDDRYLQRWIVFPWGRYARGSAPKGRLDAIRRKLPNVYLHRIRHDDADFALHDHPFASASWLLRGSYWEVMHYPMHPDRIVELQGKGIARPTVKVFRPEGAVVLRRADAAHRLVLEKRAARLGRTEDAEVVSMFFTGFVTREWGFWCERGWKPWWEFVSARDKGQIGAGCGE